jgi:hypothetical protein
MDMLAFVPSVAFLGGFLVFLFSLLNARCRWRAFCSDAACFAGESMFEAGPFGENVLNPARLWRAGRSLELVHEERLR